jgi:poly(3-hydroxybutyrate) depolymerase
MLIHRHRRLGLPLVMVCLLLSAACNRRVPEPPDRPRLTPQVILRDVTFRSVALNRDMQYRVVLPVSIAAGQKLSVVYLLHGGGGGFRDWTNYSDVAPFAESGLLLVMPEGCSSYYTNSVDQPQDRYRRLRRE